MLVKHDLELIKCWTHRLCIQMSNADMNFMRNQSLTMEFITCIKNGSSFTWQSWHTPCCTSYDCIFFTDHVSLHFKWNRFLQWMHNKRSTFALTILLQTWHVGEIGLLCFRFLIDAHSLSGPGLDSMSLGSISLNVAEELQ